MEIFLDTANLDEIKEILQWGIMTGLTTNQKIFLTEKGCNFRERVKQIMSLVKGPISIEVTSNNIDELIKEAKEYSAWGKQIVIKVPMFGDGKGLTAVTVLEAIGVKTNVTALMSSKQVMLAAAAGATYASIFFRRVMDCGDDPKKVIRESRTLIDNNNSKTKIIVGSIRDPQDVVDAALAGAHIITVPYKMLKLMPLHPKTEETIKEFDNAWLEFKKAEQCK